MKILQNFDIIFMKGGLYGERQKATSPQSFSEKEASDLCQKAVVFQKEVR